MHKNPPELIGIKGVKASFFSRQGGVSGGVYSSLNCGYGSGDDINNVAINRRNVLSHLQVDAKDLCTLKQVHSSKVFVTNSFYEWRDAVEADAIITTEKGIAIGALTADCVPILIADESGRVACAIHAGWKGAIGGIIQSAVKAIGELGFHARSLTAVIGPAISAESYEVGGELREIFTAQSISHAQYFAENRNGRYQFNLKGYVAEILCGAGIMNVSDISVDTYANEAEYFSFRRATHKSENAYGRLVSAIVLT